jgi:hypothetical protein
MNRPKPKPKVEEPATTSTPPPAKEADKADVDMDTADETEGPKVDMDVGELGSGVTRVAVTDADPPCCLPRQTEREDWCEGKEGRAQVVGPRGSQFVHLKEVIRSSSFRFEVDRINTSRPQSAKNQSIFHISLSV